MQIFPNTGISFKSTLTKKDGESDEWTHNFLAISTFLLR